jgi:hypothetical protein
MTVWRRRAQDRARLFRHNTSLALNKRPRHDGRTRAQDGYRALFTKIPQWEKWHAQATQRVQWMDAPAHSKAPAGFMCPPDTRSMRPVGSGDAGAG